MLCLRNAVASVRDLRPSDVEGLCDALLRAMGREGRPDDDSGPPLGVSWARPAEVTVEVPDGAQGAARGDDHAQAGGTVEVQRETTEGLLEQRLPGRVEVVHRDQLR